MTTIPWYYDIISPFAYLQLKQLHRFEGIVHIEPVPVLLAGLLQCWQTKGPAETPSRRRFTYRHVTWLGREHGIPLRLPAAHPFNPLPGLRLLSAPGIGLAQVESAFDFIWCEGRPLASEADVLAFAAAIGLDADAAKVRLADRDVKAQLRTNTEAATADGVFGVPTLVIDGELYWGFDATGMALQALTEPHRFDDAEMRRIGDLPVGARRKQAGT